MKKIIAALVLSAAAATSANAQPVAAPSLPGLLGGTGLAAGTVVAGVIAGTIIIAVVAGDDDSSTTTTN